MEHSFVVFFSLELTLRFITFKEKSQALRDFWFIFDASLVLLMCVDTILPLVSTGDGLGFNTSILRLARLIKVCRMGRIGKLLTRWPELNVLLKGLGIAARSVTSTIFLLLIMVYVFAIAFRYMTVDTELGREQFPDVFKSMRFLTLYATMPDAFWFVEAAEDESKGGNVMIGTLAAVFVMFSGLALLNMLIGVLCEVIGVVAALEKEEGRVTLVKDHLIEVLRTSGIDTNSDGLINKMEFQNMLLNATVVKVLREVGVDPVGLIDFVDYIFSGDFDQEDHGLTFDKLVELICELGGSNPATVKDVVDMRQVVIRHLVNIEEMIVEQSSIITCSLESSVLQANNAFTLNPAQLRVGQLELVM
jgi:hypothetical protein